MNFPSNIDVDIIIDIFMKFFIQSPGDKVIDKFYEYFKGIQYDKYFENFIFDGK